MTNNINTLLAALRQILHAQPSPEGWAEAIITLEKFEGEDLPFGIEFAQALMRTGGWEAPRILPAALAGQVASIFRGWEAGASIFGWRPDRLGVVVPPGEFTVGHMTYQFFLARVVRATHVTQAEWAEFRPLGITHLEMAIGEGMVHPRTPMLEATIAELYQFCDWLSKKDGLPPFYRGREVGDWSDINGWDDRGGWRLPTEAEWEYVARAGREPVAVTAGDFWDEPQMIDDPYGGEDPYGVALFSPPAREAGVGDKIPLPVASLKPNAWGLYDTLGNACDICAPIPLGGRYQDPLDLAVYPLRGGSWRSREAPGWGRTTTLGADEPLRYDVGLRPIRTIFE